MRELTKNEREMLRKHEIWLKSGGSEGERAYLEGADLRGVKLTGEDLRKATLRSANLEGADLHWANLEGADLRAAKLEGADLHWADLQRADLRGADLEGADLQRANLKGAILQGAYLGGADLMDANLLGAYLLYTSVMTFQYQQDFVFAYGDRIQIGCENLSIKEWVGCYKQWGLKNGYSEEEIDAYFCFIKLVESVSIKSKTGVKNENRIK